MSTEGKAVLGWQGRSATSARPATSTIRRWLAPPFALFVFLIHPAIVLLRPAWQLGDPGIGWHLATGRYILATGSIPRHEIFSFTAAGHEWIPYYWLFETAGAFLVRLGGLPLYETACMLVYAFVPALVFRRMLRMGAGMAPAFLLTIVAYLVLSSHSYARPHVLTYVLFALVLERLDDVQRGRRPARALWWMPPVAALWANVHGGFFAGLVLAAIYAGVAMARHLLFGDADERRRAIAFASVLAAMLLATLANPSGPRLHASILHHLGMQSTGYFIEFASPVFAPNAPMAGFEALIVLLVVVLARRASRLPWVEVALLVFFLHEALHSARHMNLFAIVSAPIIAREVTPRLAALWPVVHARWREIAAEQVALRSPWLYFPATCAVFVSLSVARALPFPQSLDDVELSRGSVQFIADHPARFTRPFNTDDLGGSLIYRFWPDLHVFIDDRIFVYGDDFVMHRYFAVFYARKTWQKVLAKYGVTAAVVNAHAYCATLFRASPEWELAYEDGLNAIFLRVRTGDARAGPPSRVEGTVYAD